MSLEWPKSAIGWDDSTVQALLNGIFPAGQAFVAEVHGCMVGMTGKEGVAIVKPCTSIARLLLCAVCSTRSVVLVIMPMQSVRINIPSAQEVPF